jgi:hypothetical protein
MVPSRSGLEFLTCRYAGLREDAARMHNRLGNRREGALIAEAEACFGTKRCHKACAPSFLPSATGRSRGPGSLARCQGASLPRRRCKSSTALLAFSSTALKPIGVLHGIPLRSPLTRQFHTACRPCRRAILRAPVADTARRSSSPQGEKRAAKNAPARIRLDD